MMNLSKAKYWFTIISATACCWMLIMSYSIEDSFLDVKNQVTTVTYNIRFDIPEDEDFKWDDRKKMVSQTISSSVPDIVGFQEGYYNQIKWLETDLRKYDWYAQGSVDGEYRGEFCAIFYKKDRFERLDEATIWLSEEQDKAGSMSWGASQPMVLTWIKLKDVLSGEEIQVFNTRLSDHPEARKKAGEIIKSKIAKLSAGQSFILLGDFNAPPSQDPVRDLSEWCAEAKKNSIINSSKVDFTYIGYENGELVKRRQDYVFFSNNFPVNTYEVLDHQYNELYPSDHLPVMCRLRLP